MHQLRLGKRNRPIEIDQQMSIGWRYIGGSKIQADPFLRFLNVQGRPSAQNIGHQAAVARVEVLHDDDCSRQTVRQAGEYLADRTETTGRSRYGDNVEAAVARRIAGFNRLEVIVTLHDSA
jgi:hypothetical protein